jgi:hypothetical protein
VAVEHADLDEIIEEIERLIRRQDVEALRPAAAMLADLLAAHFEHEETSAFFTTLPAMDAAVEAKVELLLREHVEMRAEMRALITSDDIAERLMRLIKKLDAHEKIELTLLEHAFSRVTPE